MKEIVFCIKGKVTSWRDGWETRKEEEVTAPAQEVLPTPKHANASRSPSCCSLVRNRENTSAKSAEGKRKVQRKRPLVCS